MSEPAFQLRPFGLTDQDQEYELILAFADRQVPQDPAGNRLWLQNRRQYDERTGQRRHYLALALATQEPVGYAALEQHPSGPGLFRLYLVFDPNRWRFQDLGEVLYQRLLTDARALDAQKLVMIEYADDAEFARFLFERGFVHSGTMTYHGFEVIRFEKTL